MDTYVKADKAVETERPPDPGTELARTEAASRRRPEVSKRQWPPRLGRLALSAGLLVLLLGGGSWWYFKPRAEVAYVSAEVTRGAVAPYVTASGSVNPVVTVQVGTYVSGVIQQLQCDFNTQVKAGQLCAKIDPRPYQVLVNEDTAALAAARAQLGKDQAALGYAKLNYARQIKLVAENLASKDAVDLARSAYDQAHAQVGLDQATVVQRQAALDAANVNLGYTNITSPVDGTVVSRNITQGQTVAASFQTPTLFLIATDLTHMQVDASVSESDIGTVKTGDMASFTVEAFPAHVFRGRVMQVRQSPQTIQNVVTYDVVVQADNPQLLLKPGMTADVRIVTAEARDALRVPVEALRYWPETVPKSPQDGAASPRVWTLRNGRPVAIPVAVGLTDDTHAQIEQGALSRGDPVIIGERAPGAAARPAAASRPRAPFL
ncbi:MAG TPA: efflux RND transporter periplasmic adaptor subunit [Steroidobacteraceae bacterium]|nr:efflux RND transporter periplasmic adaptor subunit [Steroidobacteraceae bacterium]